MRTVNPTRSFVLEHNMTKQLSCDAISIPEWKLELMAKKIFEKVWGNQNKAILRACKKSKEERTNLMPVSEKPILTFTIDFETAKRYREANKMPHQFSRAAWTDLTVEVYL